MEREPESGKEEMLFTRFATAGALDRFGECLWEYTGGAWVVNECNCIEGNECGHPPGVAGTYEGEIVRKLCEPSDS